MIDKNFILDPYFISYYLYSLALQNKDMHIGLTKALYFLKLCFDADSVILYKQNENGDYFHKQNSVLMNKNSDIVTKILNSAKDILEKQKKYELNPNLDNLHNVSFINIDVFNQKYVVALVESKISQSLNNNFIDVFTTTMQRILSKLEQYETLMKTSEIDVLTGLNNRNKYESDINIKQVSDGMIYAIFDLFRLKNINDNYSHQKGDMYIKMTAEILKKHFPEYISSIDSTGKSINSATGTQLYRVGGDEFVLISETESYENAYIKIMIIQDEVQNMNLEVDEPLGINYGLAQGKQGKTFRDLYLESDALLSKNKREYYKKMGYDRRK